MSTADITPSTEVPPVPARQEIPGPLIATIVLMACACLPWHYMYAQDLWSRPHYEFFPMVLLGAFALGMRAWQDGLGQLTPGSAGVRNALLWLAFGLLVLTGVVYSPWLGTIASLVLLVGIIWAIGGAKLWRALLPAWLFLWLGIRPPGGLDNLLVSKLQTLTAGWTSGVLDVLGVIHVMAGNVIEIVGQRLLVEEACSGIHSLFSVLTCSLFLLIWMQRRIVPSVLLVLAGIGWVLIANVARVVTIVILATRWGIDVSTGWTHWFFGWLPFVVVLGLVWSTDRLLLFFFAKRREPQLEQEPARDELVPGSSQATGTFLPELRGTGLASLRLGIPFGILAVLELAMFWPTAAAAPPPERLMQVIEGTTADTLPARIGAWQRASFEPLQRQGKAAEIGIHSRQWTYKLGALTGVLSIDYPFIGFHALPGCYKSQGWELDEQVPHVPSAEDDDYWVHARYHKPLEQYGYLWYLMVDQQVHSVAAPPEVSKILFRLEGSEKIWTRLMKREQPGLPTFQIQLFLETYAPLTPAEQDQARDLFLKTVALLRKPLAAP